MRRALSVCLLLVLALAPTGPAEAARFQIHPELRTSMVYDDNIFLEGQDEQAAFSTWIHPSLAAELDRGRLSAGGELGFETRFYADHSDLNETFWNTRAFIEYRPREDLLLRVSDAYAPRSIALGRPEDETSNLLQSNTFAAEARWRRELAGRTAIELGVVGTRFDSESFPAEVDEDGDGRIDEFRRFRSDYWELSAFLESQYEFAREARLFARAEARRRGYDDLDAGDFDELFGMVGVQTQLTPRLGFEGAVGYGSMDFNELSNESRFLGRLELEWELPRGFTILASGLRRLSGDATGTDFGETSARLSVEKRIGSRTRIEAGVWWSSFDSDDRDSDRNEVVAAELRIQRQLTSRISAALAYRYWENMGRFDFDDFNQNRVTFELVYRY